MTVRYPDFAEPMAVQHPGHGMFVGLVPGQRFDDDDPLVMARPELFVPDGTPQVAPAPVESVAIVEDASANPGESRRTRIRTRR